MSGSTDFFTKNGIQVNGALIYAPGGGNQVGINTNLLNSTLTVNGTANVSGNTNIGGNIVVLGTANVSGNSAIGGALTSNNGVGVSSFYNISVQGGYFQWNRTGADGATWIVNQKGGGSGGVYLSEATIGNVLTQTAYFSQSGSTLNSNVSIIGNLNVIGTSTLGSGGITSPFNVTGSGAETDLHINSTSTNGHDYILTSGGSGGYYVGGGFGIWDNTLSVNRLSISNTGLVNIPNSLTVGALTNNFYAISAYANNSNAIYGVANSGVGVSGVANNGVGLSGVTNTGWGTYGGSTSSGTGVYGVSNTGSGVYGISNTGWGGQFTSNTGGGILVQGSNTNIAQFNASDTTLIASINSTGLIIASGKNLIVGGSISTTSGQINATSLGAISSAGVTDISLINTSLNGHSYLLEAGGTGGAYAGGGFGIYDQTAGATRLGISNTGAVSIPGSLTVSGTITGNLSGTSTNITAYTINQNLGTGNNPVFSGLNVTGDIVCYRPATPATGVIFLNQAQNRYLYYTGGNYYLPSAPLSVGGSITISGSVVNITSLQDTNSNDRIAFTNTTSTTTYRSGYNNAGWQHTFQNQAGTTAWLMGGSNVDLTFYCAGNITTYWSDQRLKELIERVDSYEGLNRVLSYNVVDFQWNEKGRSFNGKEEGERERGLIAQEVQKINSQAVVENLLHKDEDGNPYLTIHEKSLIFDLIGAVQSQQKQIEELKNRISALEAK